MDGWKWSSRRWTGLLVAAAMAGLLAGCGGPAAPDAKFVTLQGEEKSLAQYRGMPVVLNFFGTDCIPCMAELPRFQDAYVQKGGQFELIVLSSEEAEPVQKFVSSKSYTMVFGLDRGAKSAFKVTAIPYTVFIDRLGKISYQQFGEMTGAEFDTQLERIL